MKFIETTDKESGQKRLANLLTDSFENHPNGVRIRASGAMARFTCVESWEQIKAMIRDAGGKIGELSTEYDSVD